MDGTTNDAPPPSSPHQRSYELLGAPILAFRNEEAYSSIATTIDNHPHLPVRSVDLKKDFQKNRAYARWYYPIDFHRMKMFLATLSDSDDDDDEDHKINGKQKSKRKYKRKRVGEEPNGTHGNVETDDSCPKSATDYDNARDKGRRKQKKQKTEKKHKNRSKDRTATTFNQDQIIPPSSRTALASDENVNTETESSKKKSSTDKRGRRRKKKKKDNKNGLTSHETKNIETEKSDPRELGDEQGRRRKIIKEETNGKEKSKLYSNSQKEDNLPDDTGTTTQNEGDKAQKVGTKSAVARNERKGSKDDKVQRAMRKNSLIIEKLRRKEYGTLARESKKDQLNVLESAQFISKQSFKLQQEARQFLLTNTHHRPHIRPLIRSYQKYDVNLAPAGISLQVGGNPKYGFDSRLRFNLNTFARERQDHANPIYLAPFFRTWMKNFNQQQNKYVDFMDANARDFGNCLCSFSCQCQVCQGTDNPTWWILHPTGPLLETIQMSPLMTPRGSNTWGRSSPHKTQAFRKPVELKTGDGIRHIVKCGEDTFVARGTSSFTIFRVVENREHNSRFCLGGTRTLEKVQQVDLRSFILGSFSYRPLTLTAHPRFGMPFTPSRVAVLFETEKRDAANTFRQFTIGDDVRSTEHIIPMLQQISALQYSSYHPMVLWASARSYVHSLPTKDQFRGNPKVGFGSALYSIDLRSNNAIFEWSPSAEEFVVEGFHSISGLLTDWDRENTLFVASTSARKTWELDMRMPCRSVASWSLPHYGDWHGVSGGSYGTAGAGMILDIPKSAGQHQRIEPLLAMNRTPGTSGLHLYQQPNASPLFGSWSIEAVHTPKTNSFMGSIATSTVLPLPDVVGSVFSCGLTTIRLPTSELFSAEQASEKKILDYASTFLCVVSSTSKGDVYLHPLLESAFEDSLVKESSSAPLGSPSIPVPDKVPVLDKSTTRNCLTVNLTNEYPMPSSSIVFPLKTKPRGYKRYGYHWHAKTHNHEDSIDAKRGTIQAMALSAGADMRVRVKQDLVQAQRKTFSNTTECFEDDLRRVQLRQIRNDANVERTDLSLEHLDDAELVWNQESDSLLDEEI